MEQTHLVFVQRGHFCGLGSSSKKKLLGTDKTRRSQDECHQTNSSKAVKAFNGKKEKIKRSFFF